MGLMKRRMMMTRMIVRRNFQCQQLYCISKPGTQNMTHTHITLQPLYMSQVIITILIMGHRVLLLMFFIVFAFNATLFLC